MNRRDFTKSLLCMAGAVSICPEILVERSIPDWRINWQEVVFFQPELKVREVTEPNGEKVVKWRYGI